MIKSFQNGTNHFRPNFVQNKNVNLWNMTLNLNQCLGLKPFYKSSGTYNVMQQTLWMIGDNLVDNVVCCWSILLLPLYGAGKPQLRCGSKAHMEDPLLHSHLFFWNNDIICKPLIYKVQSTLSPWTCVLIKTIYLK